MCRDVQMVSLLHLAEITEEGVRFESPVDGSPMMLTPEHSMAIQNRLGECCNRQAWELLAALGIPPEVIPSSCFLTANYLTRYQQDADCAGADIMMALDDVVSSINTTPERYNTPCSDCQEATAPSAQ